MPTLFTTQPAVYPPQRSYSGYKKTCVFSKWQRELQQQQYEQACYWTAEADASGWQDDIWNKLIVFASKQVHVHLPTLPTLLARNYAYYRNYLVTCSTQQIAKQPRNCIALRQHLCQAVGFIALSSKGPVYTLPKVDILKVDESKLIVGVHSWLVPHRKSNDSEVVIRILSTILWNLETHKTPDVMYWLSVLLAYEKQQRKNKTPIQMASRAPLPTTDKIRNLSVDPKSTHDWVWLMWLALDTASAHYRRPVACQRALRDLSYLFALDYKSSRKMTLVAVIIHAMHLVRLDTLDWSSSIYTNEQSKSMITKACTNIDVMYAEVERRRHTNLENAAKEAVNENSALSTTDDTQPVEASVTVVTKPSTQTPQKNKKGCMSEASKSKMDTMDAIDEHLFFY